MRHFKGRPIFICGMPRAGTRMIANLISSHPDVIHTDEVPPAMIAHLAQAVREADRSLHRKEHRRGEWNGRDYFLNAIFSTYRSHIRQRGEGHTRFLNKTPLVESHFEAVVAACGDTPPLFVYCARHPALVLRSLLSMPWNRKRIWERAPELCSSARCLRRMRASGADVFLVQIDRIAPDHRTQFASELMTFLGLDIAPEVQAYVTAWPTAQPAREVRGARHHRLTWKQQIYLATSPGFHSLCRQFGYPPNIRL